MTAPPVRLARCGNVMEPAGEACGGLLAFQPGDAQAACSRCQAWCGAQVADYIDAPPAADPPSGVEALRAQLAEAAYTLAFPRGVEWSSLAPRLRTAWLDKADARLLPLVVRYAKDERRKGAEEERTEADALLLDMLREGMIFCVAPRGSTNPRGIGGQMVTTCGACLGCRAEKRALRADGARGRQQ